jgi:ABC-2 type transport system permease protein
MNLLQHTWYMMMRHQRQLLRQPWWIAFSLAQPIVWLVLYGQLFKKVVELPGFHAASYLDFLTPGVVIMSALFSAGWSGMGIIMDMDRGVMDRFLVSPVSRVAIISGRLLHQGLLVIVQSLLLIGLALCMGARYAGGVKGVTVLLLCAVLLSVPFAALSNALGLTMRRQESVIGASNFILLPLTFLSPVFMAPALMPGWIRVVSRFNPVNWSVSAGRLALQGTADWPRVLLLLGCLLLFTLVSGGLATRAFRSYQRSA